MLCALYSERVSVRDEGEQKVHGMFEKGFRVEVIHSWRCIRCFDKFMLLTQSGFNISESFKNKPACTIRISSV